MRTILMCRIYARWIQRYASCTGCAINWPCGSRVGGFRNMILMRRRSLHYMCRLLHYWCCGGLWNRRNCWRFMRERNCHLRYMRRRLNLWSIRVYDRPNAIPRKRRDRKTCHRCERTHLRSEKRSEHSMRSLRSIRLARAKSCRRQTERCKHRPAQFTRRIHRRFVVMQHFFQDEFRAEGFSESFARRKRDQEFLLLLGGKLVIDI